jgi:hypothetical protein
MSNTHAARLVMFLTHIRQIEPGMFDLGVITLASDNLAVDIRRHLKLYQKALSTSFRQTIAGLDYCFQNRLVRPWEHCLNKNRLAC